MPVAWTKAVGAERKRSDWRDLEGDRRSRCMDIETQRERGQSLTWSPVVDPETRIQE